MEVVEKGDYVGINLIIKGRKEAVVGEMAIEIANTYAPGESPMYLTAGDERLPVCIQEALLGMKQGESREFKGGPERSYGAYDESLVKEIKKAAMSSEYKVGDVIVEESKEVGHPIMAKIISINENTLTIDMNHPYAGFSISGEISLLKFEKR